MVDSETGGRVFITIFIIFKETEFGAKIPIGVAEIKTMAGHAYRVDVIVCFGTLAPYHRSSIWQWGIMSMSRARFHV